MKNITTDDLIDIGFTKLWHLNYYQYDLRINEGVTISYSNDVFTLWCTNENSDLNYDLAEFVTTIRINPESISDLNIFIKTLTL